MQDTGPILVLFWVLVAVAVVGSLLTTTSDRSECEAKGGVYVIQRGLGDNLCLDKKALR